MRPVRMAISSGDHLPSRAAQQHDAIGTAATPSLHESRRPTHPSTEPRPKSRTHQRDAAAAARSSAQRDRRLHHHVRNVHTSSPILSFIDPVITIHMGALSEALTLVNAPSFRALCSHARRRTNSLSTSEYVSLGPLEMVDSPSIHYEHCIAAAAVASQTLLRHDHQQGSVPDTRSRRHRTSRARLHTRSALRRPIASWKRRRHASELFYLIQ